MARKPILDCPIRNSMSEQRSCASDAGAGIEERQAAAATPSSRKRKDRWRLIEATRP